MLEVNNNSNTDFKERMESLRQIKKLQETQIDALQNGFLTLEDGLKSELKSYLNDNYTSLIKEHTSTSLKSVIQSELRERLGEPIQQLQSQLSELSREIGRTQSSMARFEERLSVKWTKPLTLTMTASLLSGCAVALSLIFLKFTPLSLLLADEKSKQAYELGLRLMKIKEANRSKGLPQKTKTQVKAKG